MQMALLMVNFPSEKFAQNEVSLMVLRLVCQAVEIHDQTLWKPSIFLTENHLGCDGAKFSDFWMTVVKALRMCADC